jgi:tellurite resistance protein TehA-like permease
MCNSVLAVTFPMLFLSCAVWMVSVSNADAWAVLSFLNIKGAVSCLIVQVVCWTVLACKNMVLPARQFETMN